MSTSPQVPNATAAQGPGTLSADALARAYQEAVLRAQEPRQAPPGTATVQPNFGGAAIPQVQPYQQQQIHPAQAYGPGQGGAARKNDAQNLVRSVQNLAGQIGQQVQQRKQREYEQVVGQYTASVKGIQDAQAQLQQAKQLAQQGAQRLQQNPNDPQGRQMIQQAKQLGAQAQQGLKQNQLNLNDLANNPKQHKIITKAFGIDDKNANTPERQAAIKALQQTMGVGQQAANLTSRLPATAQLSPQAQQQAEAVKAGAISKPATEGQVLDAQVRTAGQIQTGQQKVVDQALKAEKIASDAGLKTDALVQKLPSLGLEAEKNPDGSYKRNPDGTLAVQNISLDQLKGNPVLAQKYQAEQTKMNLQTAQTMATKVNAAANMIRARKYQGGAIAARDPATVSNWAKLISDPKSGVTLANVPQAARSAVINAVAASGLKISKSLTSDEIKRMDLANNAVSNLSEAESILARRPDLFGPGGWGKTKMERALAGGDPDAIAFEATIDAANLPLVGVHGVRAVRAIAEIKKLDGDFYLNPTAMRAGLEELKRSSSEFQAMGGRQETATSVANTAATPSDIVYDASGQGAPAKATMKVPGDDGKLHWSDGKQDLGVVQ